MLRVLLCCSLVLAAVVAQEVEEEDKTMMVDYVNVAMGKNSSQSSTGWSGYSSRAVDGKTSGRYNDGSCTHCNNEGVMWWEVDLETIYAIDHIEIYGRTDCCSSRIQGAKLWIGNNLCTTLTDMGAAQVETVKCDNPSHSVGRTVRIEVLDYLTLCEVKVFTKIEYEIEAAATETPKVHRGQQVGNYTNVALNKPATQSSTKYNGWPSRGVDGYTNTAWSKKTCTYTSNGELNYWEVDLGRVYNIDHIMIYSRSDGSQNFLNGAKVKIGSNTCQLLADMEKTNMARVDCDGDATKRTGQIVRVELWGTTITLCEVQVLVASDGGLPEVDEVIATVDYTHLGEKVDDFFNVAMGKTASASSEPWNGKASRAIDGTTNQNWNMGSCSHTNHNGNEYWMVDLGRVYQIDHIRVWSRTDAHTGRLAGAKVWLGHHRCGTLAAKADAGYQEVTCSEVESAAQYVTVEHFGEYITLCEVQVMVKQNMIDVEPNEMMSNGEQFGNFTNVAVRKTATQSSEGWGGVASRAVDGWALTQWNQGSCTHTQASGMSEWSVDLGKVYKIDHVKFWGRTDCCQDRLKWTRVYVGRTFCGYLNEEGYAAGQPFTINCSANPENGEVSGQIVTFQRLATYLTLCEVQVMVKNEDIEEEELPSTFPELENVARNKPSHQTSVGWNGYAERAVDGYTSESTALYNAQSCTHSLKETLNYWEVDLEQEYYVDYLYILGRKDCCGDRLDGAVITMDNKTVAGIKYTSGQTIWTIPMNNAKGRRFRLTLLNEYLTICEFAIYANHTYDPATDTEGQVDLTVANLALNKVATSSSTFLGGEAGFANDGDMEGNFFKGSCMSTGAEQGTHWWSVDLIDSHGVGHVIVYQRLDVDMASYIDGAVVKVGDHVCGTIEHVSNKPWFRVDCKGMKGSTVSISKEAGYLQLCEVVVQVSED